MTDVIKENEEMPETLMMPRLVEPHAHIDKAFTWRISPNLLGTYEEALNANLEEHKHRSIKNVRLRAEKSLKLMISLSQQPASGSQFTPDTHWQ